MGFGQKKDIDCRVSRFITLWNVIENHIDCLVGITYKAVIGEPIFNYSIS